MLEDLKKELARIADPQRALHYANYFKTGEGEYGAGDIFIGITVPDQRKVARRFSSMKLSDVRKLLKSPIHEHRFTALEILVEKFKIASKMSDRSSRGKEITYIVDFYLNNTTYINNWDLVDTSAWQIVGAFLEKRPRKVLYKLGQSSNLWERRIAIISTNHFIRHNDFGDTLHIAEMLLDDDHDLIHKAVGWMLREVGNRDQKVLTKFLSAYATVMPRTMLRYAIERLPEARRRAFLSKRKL
jgi:3-methyladenine DNA glycosylase AlkD